MRIAAAGYAKIVGALLQQGANAGLQNSAGATAWSLASAQGQKQIVGLLAAKQKHNKVNKHNKHQQRETGACWNSFFCGCAHT